MDNLSLFHYVIASIANAAQEVPLELRLFMHRKVCKFQAKNPCIKKSPTMDLDFPSTFAHGVVVLFFGKQPERKDSLLSQPEHLQTRVFHSHLDRILWSTNIPGYTFYYEKYII